MLRKGLLGWLWIITFWSAVVALAVVFLTGCDNEPVDGRVVGKPHYDAWTHVYTYSCGKATCVGTAYHPERWELCVIPADKGQDFTEQYCFPVDAGRYQATGMGTMFRVNGVAQ